MEDIVQRLIELNKTVATMESCTGGGVVNSITNIPGASNILKFSAVTYSNEFKIKMGVDPKVIDKYSVYSMETANEMSKNISKFASSDYGIGITGQINRTDPNNITNENDKVYISIYDKNNDTYYNEVLNCIKDTRSKNKELIIDCIINMLNKILN